MDGFGQELDATMGAKISRSVNTRNVFAVLRRSSNFFFKIHLLSFVFAHIF